MTDAMMLADRPAATDAAWHTVLHVGCGAANPAKIPAAFFPHGEWNELRLDIDPDVAPDIQASITDMPMVANSSVDAMWSSHNLEHLAPHEVSIALAEFYRVVRPGGFVLVTVPDLQLVALQQVAALVAQDKLEDAAYSSAMGPIARLDMLYGLRQALASGNYFMAHRTGYTATSLERACTGAGFTPVRVIRDGHFALWATAVRPS